ncbi:MAG TPA: trypsin-like peptidase domain-containing protein [Gemmataceae bacterium]|nr:trypsin-like peptidase domain-containing protein [Gemmataceae bacterium]
MSIRIVCPSCRKVYNLADTMQGKTVLCRACQASITIPSPAGKGRREETSRSSDERIAKSTRSASAATRVSREEDDEPLRHPAQRRSRRKDNDSPGSKNLVPILLGVGAAALVLIGLVIGGIVLAVGLRGSKDQAAANEPPSGTVARRADAPAGPAAPAAVPFNVPSAVPVSNKPAGMANGGEAAIPPGPVPAEMATDVVKKVKQSTVYLRVTEHNGEVAQGSGFCALERGIVITNAHVVGMLESDNPPRGVEVVINSGESGETKLAGTLLGIDRVNDLAVLRLPGDPSRLPPPLPVASAAELTETQKVYIFGFPFGAQLGKAITISPSSVSSFRKENGVLKAVQVNGGMSPGNSGGPVADARGAVVGVSVAVIRGTQINFAVPADFIRPLVARGKSNPMDLTPRPGPLAQRNPAGRPAAGGGLARDVAAMKGTWQTGPVGADGGGGMATLQISINPQPGGTGGRIQLVIAAQQGGRTNKLTMTYSFTLEQDKGNRFLVTHLKQRRGTVRGMVFLYRFEGNQLILNGLVLGPRSRYKLENVALRRIAAEPSMAAGGNPAAPAGGASAAGGKPKGSPAALKISGEVFAFVEEAVRANRLTDVDIRGFKLSKKIYRDVGAEGGVLIGFQVGLGKFVNNGIVKSVRPIFLTKRGEKFGTWHGPAPATPITVKAKPGYVVSAMSLRTQLSLDAFRLTYAKLGKDGLDLSDTYNSKSVGGNGGGPSEIDGKGALFIGVTGHLNHEGVPCSLGLVAVLPKD